MCSRLGTGDLGLGTRDLGLGTRDLGLGTRDLGLGTRGSGLRIRALVLVVAVCGALSMTARGAAPRFFPDDPLLVDDDRALDASAAAPVEGSNGFDFIEHTFFKPGDRRDVRAANVNTIDEVPDSSWFTNRIGRGSMSIDEIVRGPNDRSVPDITGWPVVEGKSSGITPGFRVVDPQGRLYQVKIDPPDHPEMASGAEIIGAAIYHSLGYNVVQGFIVEIDPSAIVVAPTATIVDMKGRKRTMTRADVQKVLQKAARQPNGKYRITLSRFADGKPMGYFKYYGTRPDDPNDIHPHEHRRELRANRVFAAWINHDDSRALNTLDMLDGPPGRQYIKHYMFDFGSILGSGSVKAQAERAGNEYHLEWIPTFKTLFTLGIYVRPWILVDYWQEAKSVGRFEGDFFDAAAWRPEYPNPAFDNMRADDAFWAARLVARFSDDAIRAVVGKARFSEPGAADHVASTLIKRRDKVLRTWLTGLNPLAEPRLTPDGSLTFENAAVSARVASPPSAYVVTWARFDNATGTTTGATVETRVVSPRAEAPAAILEGATMVTAVVKTLHPDYPSWENPVTFTFRRAGTGWEIVGIDRVVPPPSV